MPKNLKIINLSSIKAQIIEQFNKKAVPIILETAAENCKDKIAEAMIQSFRETLFYSYLVNDIGLGNAQDDFRAIFGLQTSEALSAALAIEGELREAFGLASVGGIDLETGRRTKTGKGSGFVISLNSNVLKNRLYSDSTLEYISDNGELVQWFRWFVDGHTTDGYILYYPLEGLGNLARFSKSGRALMLSDEAFPGPTWETLPGAFTTSNNFFVDLLENTIFLERCNKIVRNEITKAFKNFKGKI